jgi:hypothetical protein
LGYVDVVFIKILVWQIYVSSLSLEEFTENKVFRIKVLGIFGIIFNSSVC